MADDDRPDQPDPGFDEEELRRAIEQIKVADVLVQTVSTLASLAVQRLTVDPTDHVQARLAVDAVGALLPILKGHVPEELTGQLEDLLAQLRLIYAKSVSEA